MSSLEALADRAARCFARYEYLPAAPAVIAACSGGVDSSVLAVALARLAARGRLPGPLVLAYLDHRQDPAHAPRAQRAVAELSRALGAGFVSAQLRELTPRASEEAMRDARYRALVELALQCEAGWVVTGHHADDDLETVLFRLLRGTGPRGLAGIPEHRELAAGVHLLRPFLAIRRADLAAVADALGLSPVDDPANADPRFARNRLRSTLLPQLREAAGGDALDTTLVALARAAKATSGVLEAQARRILAERGAQPTPWLAELDLRGLTEADRPFVREALRQLDAQLRVGLSPTPWPVLERVCGELWPAAQGRRVHGKGAEAVLFERTREGLLAVVPSRAPQIPFGEQPIAFAGAAFGEWTVTVRAHAEPPLEPSPAAAGRYRALLDLRRVPEPWALRARRSGDRFWPLGAAGPVELRRFLSARGVPRFVRDRLPLLVDAGDRICWVPGAEIAEPCRVRSDTAACIELRAERHAGAP